MSPFLTVIGIGLLGAITSPLLMLALARFGCFESVEFELFGRTWRFAPPLTMFPPVASQTTIVFSFDKAAVAGSTPGIFRTAPTSYPRNRFIVPRAMTGT